MQKGLKLYDYRKFTKEQIDKFNSSFKKVKNKNKDSKFYQDDCWLWQLKDERFAVDKVKIISRKFSYCLHHKEVLDSNKKEDKNFVIITDCGNPSCVNPEHLIKITKHQFNIRTNTGRFVGIKKSPETVRRMKIAQNRPEHKEKIRRFHLGRKRPPEVGAKIKEALNRPEVHEKRIESIRRSYDSMERRLKTAGENSVRAKLNNEKVRFLRANVREYGDYEKYAAIFNVAPSTIRNAVDGTTWKYIDYQGD